MAKQYHFYLDVRLFLSIQLALDAIKLPLVTTEELNLKKLKYFANFLLVSISHCLVVLLMIAFKVFPNQIYLVTKFMFQILVVKQ
jgi:hypothetical protein